MEDGCWKITKEMTISEAVERFPHLHRVLASLGMSCCACCGADTDTIERAARVYGLQPDILVRAMNVALLFPDSEESRSDLPTSE